MNFEDEHYVRVYTRDTKTWLRLGWQGQALFCLLLRKVDKAGILDDVEDPVDDLTILTGLPPDVVAEGYAMLLRYGVVELNQAKLLLPQYIAAQTAIKTDRQRARDSRERRRLQATASPKDSTIYFAATLDGLLKIGISSNVQRRLAGLQTGHPGDLQLVGTIPGDLDLEDELHQACAQWRKRGEWFQITTELAQLILVKCGIDLTNHIPRHTPSHTVTSNHEQSPENTPRRIKSRTVTQRSPTQSNAVQRSCSVDPKDLTGSAHDVGLEQPPPPPPPRSEVFEARGTVRVEREPTRPDNPKPPRPVALELSDPPAPSGSSERVRTLPHVAEAPKATDSGIQVNPRSRTAVLALPINERARWYLANLHQFGKGSNDWAMPHTWPEVVQLLEAYHASAKLRPPKPGLYASDFAVQAVIAHYDAGHSFEELLQVYMTFPKSELFKTRVNAGKRPRATWITTEVLRIELEGPPKQARAVAPAQKLFAPDSSEPRASVAAVPAAAYAALRRI